jgi:4-hydroxybenzoate polyprenyltransferase
VNKAWEMSPWPASLSKIRTTLEMIKWEHSIFALPFALTAMLLAAGGLAGLAVLAWIVVAMVAARSAAMAFNRWADADLDAANPRTKNARDSGGEAERGSLCWDLRACRWRCLCWARRS